jgi:serine/threonine protein kinase/tetratricopeptide (TPR) repeat protein
MTDPAQDLVSRLRLDVEPSDEAEDLLAHCLALPEPERQSALEKACAQQPELANELRLRVAVLRSMGIELSETRGFPEQLGDFRLIELLGGGGMGVVYLAVQTSLQRDVALKLIRPEHLFFAGARARFRREAEAVARLQHPGIVPIYAVGEEQGIPYFAMELVRGCTLAEALRALQSRAPESLRGADLHAIVAAAAHTNEPIQEGSTFGGSWVEACLRIARQVADALQHAHERGLVHRDVKPSNIALTPDGRALLLDFGLTSTDGGGDMTRTGSTLGTLHYMSPEQLRGARTVDATSDVYSLGVTLYEMLTLQVPYRGENALEMQRLLLDHPDPIRPRNRRVEGDVETAVLCALDRDPARRYATASDFARDLGHLLAHRPIEARRPGPWLRMRRWSQRQPALATALVLGPALLLGTGVAFLAQAVQHAHALGTKLDEVRAAQSQTQREEQRARSEAETAQHALDFVVGMFTPEPLAHGAPAARAENVADLFLHGESGVAAELAGDPRAQARMYTVLGRLHARRRSNDRALELYERALDLWRTQDVDEVGLYQSETLTYLGEALHEVGRGTEGNARLREALTVLPAGPAGERTRERILADLLTLGSRSDHDALLEAHARQALQEELARPTPDTRAISHCRCNLGSIFLGRRQYDAAAELLQQAYDEITSLPGAELLSEFNALVNDLALARNGQGRTAAAVTLLARALEAQRTNFPGDQKSIGIMLLNLASMEESVAPKDCLRHARESIATLERALTPEHPLTLSSQARLAWYASRMGECDEADEAACRVLEGRANLDPTDPTVGRALMSLAISSEKRGLTSEAEEYWRRAALASEPCPGFSGGCASAVYRLGVLRLDAGAIAEAEMLLARSYDTMVGEPDGVPAPLLHALARVARARGREAAALSYESRLQE